MDIIDAILGSGILAPRVKELEEEMAQITNPLVLKGRVDTVADLANVQDPQPGWVYLVGLAADTNKKEYVYTATNTWEFLGYHIDVDSTPTQGSSNPVSSGGVYTALADKIDISNLVTVTNTGDVYIGSQLIRKVLTQTEYDALATKDPKVDYLIVPAST